MEQQVLISLKLLASGSFQSSAKDNINVAQSTVSCTLSRFMDSLLLPRRHIITVAEQPTRSNNFYTNVLTNLSCHQLPGLRLRTGGNV